MATIISTTIISCNVYNITKTSLNSNYSLTNIKTFAWVPDRDTANNEFDNKKIRIAARNIITQEMQKRGFVLNPESPDILIDTHIENFPETKETTYRFESKKVAVNSIDPDLNPNYNPLYNKFYYPNPNNYFYTKKKESFMLKPYMATYVTQRIDYTENTISISILAANDNTIIWSSVATANVQDAQQIGFSIHPAIRKMIKKVPF